MMKKTYLAIGFVMLVIVGGVFAYQGESRVRNPFHSEDRHLAMETAFETGDYDSWKSLMEADGKGSKRVLSVINEENFERFVQMHEANEAGDYQTADVIRNELGLGVGEKGTGCVGKSLDNAGKGGCDHSFEGGETGCPMQREGAAAEHKCGGCKYAN